MAKEVPFASIPRRGSPDDLDRFVGSSEAPPPKPPPAKEQPKMKRLTFEVLADQHTELKVACAIDGKDMVAVLRELIGQYLEARRASKP